MKKFAAILSLLATTACSTIIEGRSQQLTINTNPPEASCILLRQSLPIATINSTPGSAYIEKTKYDITVECTKEGYQKATYLNHSGVAGATFGNIALGGLIGWGVDSATGADNKYETPMNVTLVPDEAPKKKQKKHKEDDD